MRMLIAGGTGFIGKAMVRHFAPQHTVWVLTRTPERAESALPEGARAVGWDGQTLGEWASVLNETEVVVNLAGEPIAQRWTPEVKRRLWDSRVRTTELLAQAIMQATQPPRLLLQASAIGIYDQSPAVVADENGPYGTGFLAELGKAWEAAAQPVEARGVRVCYMRIGVVLGRGGGALERMLTPFKLGVGGSLGSGKQWLSWIHLRDVVEAAAFLIAHEDLRGAFNFTAPNPVTMNEFARVLGRVLLRPAFLRAPAFALRLMLGEMAEFLLEGSRVLPKRLLEAGYSFRFPTVDAALRDLLTQ